MPVTCCIRNERESDCAKISDLITQAFKNDPHSDGREADIVVAMRDDSALSFSLVAELDGGIVGHIAFSRVTIDDHFCGWYGLAPVSVAPDQQNNGIGSELIRAGIELLKGINAKGCVVLGEPSYYQRFGFKPESQLILPGVPAEYFQALSFSDSMPSGSVKYHPAFG